MKRDYFDEPGCSFNFDFQPLLDKEVELVDIFFELTRYLKSHFYINRGVLVLRDPDTERLAAVSTWHNGNTRDGLAINLPSESSLFVRVVEGGRVYTEDFCETFSGNFFERKLLLDESSQSFVLNPLRHEGKVVGLLGYSSEEPTAFSVFEEGILEHVTGGLAQVIHQNFPQ